MDYSGGDCVDWPGHPCSLCGSCGTCVYAPSGRMFLYTASLDNIKRDINNFIKSLDINEAEKDAAKNVIKDAFPSDNWPDFGSYSPFGDGKGVMEYRTRKGLEKTALSKANQKTIHDKVLELIEKNS